MTERTAVYRWFDADGALLYVGLSSDPAARADAHRHSAPWWDRVASCQIEWFPTRIAAQLAETRAINNETPRANVKRIGKAPTTPAPAAEIVDELVAAAGERGVVVRVEPARGALSPEEAAEWLGVSVPTVYRLMADGRLTYVALGGRCRRIARSALERFVDPELAAVAS